MNRLQDWMLYSAILFLHFQLLHAISCPVGWHYFDGSCFFVEFNDKTCLKAQQDCSKHGAHLAKLNSQKRIDYFKAKNVRYIWIGLHKHVSTNTWRWHNENTAATFTRWDVADEQPDNREDVCINARYLDKWHDQNGEHKSNSVCEKPVCKCRRK
ncbi:type-2 ice-structuring protein-like [Physella acuta]|uniref:type-2 ice-structuring protein-like n=1 Tax=Physella acuta TaxID=109671 RepID=UPI0027DBF387|nr:type-2 ice-structuring protein-like [Physella acuta]